MPITFGFKVAVWVDELTRHVVWLRQIEPRLFVVMTGGAAGTCASLGPRGPAVQERVAHRLGMAPMTVPARSLGDHLAEYVCVLALFAAWCGSQLSTVQRPVWNRDSHAKVVVANKGMPSTAARDCTPSALGGELSQLAAPVLLSP